MKTDISKYHISESDPTIILAPGGQLYAKALWGGDGMKAQIREEERAQLISEALNLYTLISSGNWENYWDKNLVELLKLKAVESVSP